MSLALERGGMVEVNCGHLCCVLFEWDVEWCVTVTVEWNGGVLLRGVVGDGGWW